MTEIHSTSITNADIRIVANHIDKHWHDNAGITMDNKQRWRINTSKTNPMQQYYNQVQNNTFDNNTVQRTALVSQISNKTKSSSCCTANTDDGLCFNIHVLISYD